MNAPRYDAAIYPGNGAERARWAVAAYPSAVWYYPRAYGRKAAERLARELNARARP